MTSQLLDLLKKSPIVLEMLMIYLRANKMVATDFFKNTDIAHMSYHFMAMFIESFGLRFVITKDKIVTYKTMEQVSVCEYKTYSDNILMTIIKSIVYCEKPF